MIFLGAVLVWVIVGASLSFLLTNETRSCVVWLGPRFLACGKGVASVKVDVIDGVLRVGSVAKWSGMWGPNIFPPLPAPRECCRQKCAGAGITTSLS